MGDGKHKQGISAIFDIGGSTIGAALVASPSKGGVPEVIYATRAPMPFLKEQDPARLTQAMLSTFVVVALRLQREGLPRIPRALPWGSSRVSYAYCFFSSPWHSSTVSKFRKEEKTPFVVPDDISKIFFEENAPPSPRVDFLSMAKEPVSKKRKSAKSDASLPEENGVIAIERHIIQVYANGYPTKAPKGQKVSTLEARVVGSVVPKALYEKLHSVIDRVLHGGVLEARSFFMPLSGMARTTMPEHDSYLLVTAGGEVCDVAVIIDDAPEVFISMPFGIEPLVRIVAEKAKIVPEEVVARLTLLQSGTAEESLDKKSTTIVRVLAEVEREWKDLIRNALYNAPMSRPLPKTAFVWSEGTELDWFRRLFSLVSVPEASFSTEPFTVIGADNATLKKLARFAKNEEYDGALAAEASFILN